MIASAASSLLEICRTGIPGYDPWATATEGMYFDLEEAEFRIAFIEECLVHVIGDLAGQPLLLEDWEKAIIGNLYGWKRADGRRRYREGFFLIPRKNGKTTIGSAILQNAIFIDEEPGAEIFSIGSVTRQSKLVYRMIAGQIRREPELAARCTVQKKAIFREELDLVYEFASSDAGGAHGSNPYAVLADELHLWENQELYEGYKTGMGTRGEPLLVCITTADFDRPSLCNELRTYAENVRDGLDGFADPEFLPVIFAADPDKDDWTDPEVWRRVNPNLGVSLPLEFLEKECARAKRQPSRQNVFKRLYLNMRTSTAEKWLDLQEWRPCTDFGVTPESLHGQRCWGGLDVSKTRDITSFCLVFPGELWRVLCWSWVPEHRAIELEQAGRPYYMNWARDGWLTLTEGNWIDFPQIQGEIVDIVQPFEIIDVGVDPWNSTATQQALIAHGINAVEFGQGYKDISEPCLKLENELLPRRLIRHNGNPVMEWAVQNAMCRRDGADNVRPDKEKSRDKIDPLVAMVMAIGRCIKSPAPQQSVYSDPDELWGPD